MQALPALPACQHQPALLFDFGCKFPLQTLEPLCHLLLLLIPLHIVCYSLDHFSAQLNVQNLLSTCEKFCPNNHQCIFSPAPSCSWLSKEAMCSPAHADLSVGLGAEVCPEKFAVRFSGIPQLVVSHGRVGAKPYALTLEMFSVSSATRWTCFVLEIASWCSLERSVAETFKVVNAWVPLEINWFHAQGDCNLNLKLVNLIKCYFYCRLSLGTVTIVFLQSVFLSVNLACGLSLNPSKMAMHSLNLGLLG